MDTQSIALELLETGRIGFRADPDSGVTPGLDELARLAADEIGVPLELVVLTPCTDPNVVQPPSRRGARRSNRLAGGAVTEAARSLKSCLIDVAAELLNRSPEAITFSGGWALAEDDEDSPLLTMADLAAAILATNRPLRYERSFGLGRSEPAKRALA